MNYSYSSNVAQIEQTNDTTAAGISTINLIKSQSQTIEEEEEKEEEELDPEARIIKLENSNKALKSMNKELLAYASQLASQLINK